MRHNEIIRRENIWYGGLIRRLLFVLLMVLIVAPALVAQTAAESPTPLAESVQTTSPSQSPTPSSTAAGKTKINDGTANPVVLIIVMGALALAPFALIMLTSFVKISVVLSILRNALGTQQIPPNQVITGLSLILTIFIMTPVVEKMFAQAGDIGDTQAIFSEKSVEVLFEASKKGREPLLEFLLRHVNDSEHKLFYNWARAMAERNGNDPNLVQANEFRIVIPSFVISQLSEAFAIGFLLFIPFLIIDLVVANILQAMGMFMLSPTIISLPFKILLFVLIDGWVLLVQALVISYT